jgi:S1-C subfamily serine protease
LVTVLKVMIMGQYGEHRIRSSSAFIIMIFIAGLVFGGIASVYVNYQQMSALQKKLSNLADQVSRLSGNQTVYNENVTIYQNTTALVELHQKVKDSVVLVSVRSATEAGEGSGFVYNYSGAVVVITNYHVVHGAISISVTFSDGDGYSASVLGKDPYADLAVLNVSAPQDKLKPLDVVSSSTLKVGDLVIAIGNPYGLVGSMTTGIVSALGRTIDEEQLIGNFRIANIIQTSVLINPGNSGGPLLNALGKVVGITTAVVKDAQGLAFAIPSNAIQKEIGALITNGSYSDHSYLGVAGTDMTYELAQQYHVNVTYGWRVVEVNATGPAHDAGIQAGDVIIEIKKGINVTRIRNGDEMLSYMEENTVPNETVELTVVRGNQTQTIPIVLGTRPPPPV